MSKALPFLIAAVEIGVGIATGNVALIVSGGLQFAAATVALLTAPHAAKPDTTETSIKTERPPRVRAMGESRLYGASICYETVDGKTIDVWAFHDGAAHAILRTYLNDNQVTVVGNVVQTLADKSYQGGNVTLGYSMGAPTETAFSQVTALLPAWNSNHRGDGVVCGWLIKNPEKDKYYLETYPQGDSVALSLVGQWTPKYDPRDEAQDPYDPSTWGWSDNAVLAFIWYKMVERGYDWDRQFAPQLTRLLAAINIADEDVSLAVGGTEKRYRTALSYNANEEPANIEASLLACFDGWYILNEKSEVILYAGAYYEPTVSIGPDQTVAWRQQMNVETENFVNEIAVPYVSSLHDYGTVDGEPWRDEDDISSRGRVNTAELGAVVPSFTQGRRLAKIKMSRNNAADRGTTTTTFGGRAVLEQRFINLRNEEAGGVWFDGVAEIIAAERDPNTGGVTFDWVAADANAFAWNGETEDGEGAPVGTRVGSEPLTAPTISSAVTVYTDSTDTGTGVRVLIDASGDDLPGTTWFARWRKDSSSVWNEQQYNDLDPGHDVELLTSFVPVTAGVQVEVEYRTVDGKLSGWSSTQTVDTRTNVAVPDAASGITLVNWTDALRLNTARIPRASTYRWRFFNPSDLTTPLRTITTSIPEVAYTAAQAGSDGVRRDYVAKVAGVNGAGAGTEATSSTMTLSAPAAVTGVSATGGASEAEIDFTSSTDPTVAGYLVVTSTATGFDPSTQGSGTLFAGTPAFLQNYAAGTYYAKVAAFDAWTTLPGLLNFSSEQTFTITSGGGGVGGGGGDGGGGYCVTIDTPILMADGSHRVAGDLVVGDMLRTQHEHTLEWGDYPVEAIQFKRMPVLFADLGATRMRATADHAVWLGGDWLRFDAIGTADGRAMVALITVTDAHTYVSNGVLSHNVRYKGNPGDY